MALRPDALTLGRIRPLRVALPRAMSWPRLTASRLVFGASLGAYLTVAAIFVFGAETLVGDAFSRVGNAYYILFSRDPHLAAIGFVWNPLPAMATLPLLPFSALWPSLVHQGFAGNIVSAVFMAAAVQQIWAWTRDLGLGRISGIALTVLFAAHPLIVLYGANGMSEAAFICFLVMAARGIAKWVGTQRVRELVWAGGALSLAYLTRYEAVAAAGAGLAFVAAVTFVRSRGETRERAPAALADAVVMGMPFAVAFASWSFASWIIVGSPFETFTSVYGGSNQIALSIEGIRRATGETPMAALGYAARQIIGLHPLLLPIVGAAGVAAIVRRDARVVAVGTIFGSVLLFSLALFLAGKSFGWLRFYIAVVPLGAMAAAYLISLATGPAGAVRWPSVDVRRAAASAAVLGGSRRALAATSPVVRRGSTAAAAGVREVAKRLEAVIGQVRVTIGAVVEDAPARHARLRLASSHALAVMNARRHRASASAQRVIASLDEARRNGSTGAIASSAAQRAGATARLSMATARRRSTETMGETLTATSDAVATTHRRASHALATARRRAIESLVPARDRAAVALVATHDRAIAARDGGIVEAARRGRTLARAAVSAVAARRPIPPARATVAAVAARATNATARGALILMTLGLVAMSLPSGLATVDAYDLAREEAPALHGLGATIPADMPSERHQYRVARDVASYLDARDLPDGAVVVDVALGFWVVLQSDRPKQFVITPDRDFEAVVADPVAFGAKYLLVSPSAGMGSLSLITRTHPGVYDNGAGIATLEREFTSPGGAQHTWRLYRIND